MIMNNLEPIELLVSTLTNGENAETSEYSAPTPGRAYWNQRGALAEIRPQIEAMMDAIGENTNLTPYQWTQLLAYVLEFKPDMILELGRGEGNSTCVFTTAANRLAPEKCEVVSLCLSDTWTAKTLPKLEKMLPAEWFAPLQTHSADILTFDYESVLDRAERVLVFWDAHGFDVAECVLGRILPLIQHKTHVIINHDMSDGRYMSDFSYGDHRLWRGNNWEGPRLQLGHINSAVEQAVSVVDFCSRNKVTFHSADHSLKTYLEPHPEMVREMKSILGENLFQLQAHWFYFTLNNHSGPLTFPNYSTEKIQARNDEKMGLYGTLTRFNRMFKHNKDILIKAAQNVLSGGLNLLQSGQAAQALDRFGQAEKMCVGFDLIGLNYARAHALMELGRYAEARTALETELDLDPSHEPSFNLLNYLNKNQAKTQWPGQEESRC